MWRLNFIVDKNATKKDLVVQDYGKDDLLSNNESMAKFNLFNLEV